MRFFSRTSLLFKFILYVQLFLSALGNLILGIGLLAGTAYGEYSGLVYAVAPNRFGRSGPSCVATGRCPEGKMSCGKIKEVQAKYAAIHTAGK